MRTAATFSSGEYRRCEARPGLFITDIIPSLFPSSGISTKPRAIQATFSNIVEVASKYIGMPYGRGAGNGSFDCCTLARHVYREALGINLPMSVPGNPAARSKCEYAMYSLAASYGGRYVPATLASLQPGDIPFFQASYISPSVDNTTHVAIYIGGGQVIDAIPSAGVGIRNLSFYTVDKLLPQAVRIG